MKVTDELDTCPRSGAERDVRELEDVGDQDTLHPLPVSELPGTESGEHLVWGWVPGWVSAGVENRTGRNRGSPTTEVERSGDDRGGLHAGVVGMEMGRGSRSGKDPGG